MSKFIVWVKEGGRWEPNGDGPMSGKDAQRVAKEIKRYCGCPAKVLPAGMEADPAPMDSNDADGVQTMTTGFWGKGEY